MYGPRYILLIWSVWILSSLASGQDAKQLKEKREKIIEEIAYTNKLIDNISSDKKASIQKLKLVEVRIDQRRNLLANYKLEIHDLNKSIEQTSSELNHLDQDLKALRESYARLAWYAYQYQMPYNKLVFLFSAESMNQAYQRIRYLDQLAAHLRQEADKIKSMEGEKQRSIVLLTDKKEKLASLSKAENADLAQLESEKLEKQHITSKLAGQEKQLRASLRDKEKESKTLEKKIEEIINAEARKAAASSSSPDKTYALTPEEKSISGSFVANKGKLPWPLERGIISETYGIHNHPVLKKVQTKNNGLDLSTSSGSDARCVYDGIVASVTRISNTNIAVIVRHGEYFTVYSNLEHVYVGKGDKVKTRQLLGRIHTNLKGETELHFEIRKGTTPQNPVYWINR